MEKTNHEIGLAIIDSPAWFAKNILGSTLYDKQIEIIEAIKTARRVAVFACHDCGKTYVAAGAVCWNQTAFAPEAITSTTAPTAKQVNNLLWEEIRKAHDGAKIPLGGKVLDTPRWSIGNKHFAYGFAIGKTKKDSESAHGLHAERILIVVDEASGVVMHITDALSGSLASENTCILFIGNPTRTDTQFYKELSNPDTVKITITAFDTPNFTTFGITLDDIANNTWKEKITGPLPYPQLITPQWVSEVYRDWGPNSPMFQAKVMATFPKAGSDRTLIPLQYIEAAQERDLSAEVEPTEPVVFGVDVARFGSDRTEIYSRQGPVCRHKKSIFHFDNMEVTSEVVQLENKLKPKSVHVDGVGLGSGVVDRLKELTIEKKDNGDNVVQADVFDMQSGCKPTKELKDKHGKKIVYKFLNKKAEWYWDLRKRFVEGTIDIDPDDHILAAQLFSVEYKFDSSGQKLMIVTKEEMKAKQIASPDRADALMLAFAEMPTVSDYYKNLIKL